MNIKKMYMKKKITILLFLLFTYSIASAQEIKGMDMNKKETKLQVQSVTYTCPMHPEIHAPRPGNCPKCGMKLIKEKPKQVTKPKSVKPSAPPRTIRYDLYIADTVVTFGKKSKRAIAVNGQIPMPTLIFTEGDTAEIYV